jgi:hypothetical protein
VIICIGADTRAPRIRAHEQSAPPGDWVERKSWNEIDNKNRE